MKILETINKNNIYKSFFIYFLIIIIFKLSTPYGDEPDFDIRSFNIIKISEYIYSNFSFSNTIKSLTPINNCIMNNFNFLWYNLNYETCSTSSLIFIKRIILQVFFIFPLLLTIFLSIRYSDNKSLIDRANVCMVSLFYSGCIYYTGLLSHESFTVVLSFMIFLHWKNPFLVFIFLLIIGVIDKGNAMVICIFISIYFLINLFKFLKIKNYLLFSSIFILLLILISSTSSKIFMSYVLYESELIKFIPNRISEYLFILETHHYYNSELFDKYHIIFRSIITILTSIYFTAYGVTVFPVIMIYLITFITILILFIRQNYKINFSKEESVKNFTMLITSISTILIITVSIPAYCNAKYYIFLVPFIINFLKDFISLNKILNFFILMSLLISFFLRSYLF